MTEKEKIEEYLVEVTNRLLDTQTFMEALKHTVTSDKTVLIRNGQSFAYQQGILDILDELKVYASGDRNFQEDAKKVLAKMNEGLKAKAERDEQSHDIYG